MPFFRSSKILAEPSKQEILQQMFRKFSISNRLPNTYFPKIDVGCPRLILHATRKKEREGEKKAKGKAPLPRPVSSSPLSTPSSTEIQLREWLLNTVLNARESFETKLIS